MIIHSCSASIGVDDVLLPRTSPVNRLVIAHQL